MNSQLPRYVLISAARNEDAFIELTLRCISRQSHRPVHCLIVSDGSTDRTDEIVEKFAREHTWIELFRMPKRDGRDFGGKARCVNTGYERLKHVPHDAVVSLDADLTFDDDYFEFLMGKLASDPKLGLIGTPFSEDGKTYDYRYTSIEHVSGACQVFRKECFQAIGGYVFAKGGGMDVIAVLSSRMRGWKTRTYTEKACEHHRPMGSANHGNKIVSEFKLGQRGYRLGFHPLWQLFRTSYQMMRKPYIIGGSALLAGYLWAAIKRQERPMTPELVAFQRRDQMLRLRKFLRLGGPGSASKA